MAFFMEEAFVSILLVNVTKENSKIMIEMAMGFGSIRKVPSVIVTRVNSKTTNSKEKESSILMMVPFLTATGNRANNTGRVF